MNSDKKLLREYIKLIVEDDGGDVGGFGSNGGPGGYGMSYADGSELYDIFVKPFVRPFQVATGKGKEVAVKAQTLGKVLVGSIASTLLPSVQANYQKIFDNEKKKMDGLKQQYQPVYDRVWQAFDHDDVRLVSFMYDPFAAGMFLSYFGGKGGLGLAIDALDIITGGSLGNLKARVLPKKNPAQKAVYDTGSGTDTPMEGRLREAGEIPGDMNNEIQSALQTSSAQRMRGDAQKVVQSTLKDLVTTASKILKATSVKELTDSIPPEQMQQFETLPPAEKSKIESQVLTVAKKSTKEFFVKSVEDTISKALQSGVPEQSAYIRDYRAALQKIQGMS